MTQRMPIDYPWLAESHSGLLDGSTYSELELRRGRRFGIAQVRSSTDQFVSINQHLVEANVATIDSRVLVVAVGSNASPAVMAAKFSDNERSVSTVLPFVKCSIRGISVGHSAHVSKRGYIAAAPFAKTDATSELWASWLDLSQLDVLDSTEPNYQRILVSNSDYPIRLESGESPESYYLYESVHGVIASEYRPREFTSQASLFEWLALKDGGGTQFAGDPNEVIGSLAEDASRERARLWFRASTLTFDSQLVGKREEPVRNYGSTPSIFLDEVPSALRVLGTSDSIDRIGEQCVVINPLDADDLGLGSHAVIQQYVASDPAFSSRPGMLIKVLHDDLVVRGTIGVDQIVRNGLGIERQEYASLKPAKAADNRLSNLVSGSPHYVVCRVHAADLSSVEQDIALVDPIAMRFLGIGQGDVLIIEGVADDGDAITAVRVRAIELESQIRDFRMTLAGGGLDARFPNSADALGVFPDLPQIFLDSALRTRLGLGANNLCTVRIRASRRHQLLTQMREVLLILVLAFIGLATLFQDFAVVVTLLVAVLVVAGLVVHGRLQSQLGLMRSKRRHRRKRTM